MLDHEVKRDFYVYVYFDPRIDPPEPIYVGKGYGTRDVHHLGTGQNQFLTRKIAKIKKAGLLPIIKREHDGLTESEAFFYEMKLISEYGRNDLGTGTLCNFTNGGEGSFGRICSNETKELFSKQRRGRVQTPKQYEANLSRRHSDATKQRMSEINKGHSRHTPEQIEAIRNYSSTRVISDETRKLWSAQRKGHKQTPEHVAKVKQAKADADARRLEEMGPKKFAAYKQTAISKRIGQKRSEETKEKMRQAWVRRKQRA